MWTPGKSLFQIVLYTTFLSSTLYHIPLHPKKHVQLCTRQIWALGSCYSPRRCHQWVRVGLLPLIWGQLTISATASIMIMVLMILMIIMIMVLTMVMMASIGKGWHQEKKRFLSGIVSSVRSSNSHPDLLLTHPPTFSDLACVPLYNNMGLSLSNSLQLYQKQSLDSSAGYMYTLCAR